MVLKKNAIGEGHHSTIQVRTMHLAKIASPNGRKLFRFFQTSILSHVTLSVWIISAWLGLAGCVYIPPVGQQATVDPANFKVGSTSRSEVMRVLGDPLVDDGRFILDQLRTDKGGFLFLFPGPGSFLIGAKYTRLLLEFNEANILERMDIETGSYDISGGRFGGPIPDKRPLQELEPLGELLPFSDSDVSWLGTVPIFHFAAFSPKRDLIAAMGVDDQIFIIDLVRRTIERISPEGFEVDGFFRSMTFSPDGNSLAVLSKTIRIIDLKTLKQSVLYQGHGISSFWETKRASTMAYAPSGEVIASAGSGGVKIWEASTGHEIASWDVYGEEVFSIAFSMDGAMLATSGRDGFVRLWDRKTGAELGAIKAWDPKSAKQPGDVWKVIRVYGRVAFSDDGKLLAIASFSHAELWRLDRDSSGTSQGQTLTLDGPMDMIILPYFTELVKPIAPIFTPGGRRLLLGYGWTVIWDWTERRRTLLSIPFGHKFLAFSPDGRTMATSGRDGVRLWKLPVMKNN